MEKERGHVDQAIDPVEDAAVAGDERAHVLGANVTLNHTDGKIAELAADANDESGQNQLPRAEVGKRKAEQPGQNHRDYQRAERAFPGFFWADFAAQRMTAEQSSEGKRRDVVQLRRKDDVDDVAVGVCRIGEKPEMT